jgi:hypothetical protein
MSVEMTRPELVVALNDARREIQRLRPLLKEARRSRDLWRNKAMRYYKPTPAYGNCKPMRVYETLDRATALRDGLL